MPWIDEGGGFRSFYDVDKGLETKSPIIDFQPEKTNDSYDELDDFGNETNERTVPREPFPYDPWSISPIEPKTFKGWWEPGTVPEAVIPPAQPYDPWKAPMPAPAVPEDSPQGLEPPVEPKTWWDKITPGAGETPGETFEGLKLPDVELPKLEAPELPKIELPEVKVPKLPKVDFGITEMVPLIVIGLLSRDRE